MTGFLRFIGVMNAAVWLGTAIFFTLGVLPACFSADMKTVLNVPGSYFSSAISGVLMHRYYHVSLACGVIAMLHFLAEWLYMGRPRRKFAFGLVVGLFVLALIGSNAVQPALVRLNRTHYYAKTQPERESGGKTYHVLSVLGIALNVLTIGGLVIYVSRVSSASETLRFVRPVQFGR